MTLTRAKFEQMVDPLVERCRGPVLQAMKDARLKTKDIDEVVMVGGMTRMPRISELVKEIYGKEGHKGVNPDEVVAIGAAIQGAQLLLGSKSDVLLLDVTPLTLGIETEGGILTPMSERNTSIPKDAKNVFSTAADGQTRVSVRVFQGESQLAEDPANRLLGEFDLDGIPPAARGMPKIEVMFKLDHNGILNVHAKDLGTGKENTIEIKGSSGLDPKEVEKMRKDAESHASETKKKVEIINARNEAEHQVYAVEKALKDNAEKISAGDRSAVEAAVSQVKSVAKGDDAAAIKRAVEELTRASQAMAQHLYSQAPPQEGADGAAASKGEDVQDAEFEVKS